MAKGKKTAKKDSKFLLRQSHKYQVSCGEARQAEVALKTRSLLPLKL